MSAICPKVSYGFNRLLPCKLAILIVLSLAPYCASAQSISPLIDKLISHYKETYPEIEFTLLLNRADLDQLLPLTNSLGKDLSNVDYEHPEEARITLVEAQEYRLSLQISNGNGSATLFKTPNARITKKPYVCLITLDLSFLDAEPLAATRFMYDIDEETLSSLPESFQLDNHDFFLYTIDHEIFHCIDAYTNGFLYPRTRDPIKSCLDRFRIELRTEIYSAMAHLSRQPNGKRFLKNLATARTVNLLSGDVEHYTREALHMLVENDELNISSDIKTLAEEAMRFAEKLTPDYADHKEFLVAAWAALEELGVDGYVLLTDYPELAIETPLPENVKALTGTLKNALMEIRPNELQAE